MSDVGVCTRAVWRFNSARRAVEGETDEFTWFVDPLKAGVMVGESAALTANIIVALSGTVRCCTGPIILQDALSVSSVEDLTQAVDHCKDMVLESPECSEERKWLVRRLIELRFRLQDMKEAAKEEKRTPTSSHSELRVLLGHHFILQTDREPTSKRHCDRCCGIIWSVVHSWYQCTDCKYSSHVKCLPQVCRVCAHVQVTENPTYITNICPEIGLSAQVYRCTECKAHITFKNSWVEPRLCDYNGQYFCPNCHWNSTAVIPARVIHNWDFEERKVCRASRQVLHLMIKLPVIKLERFNPRLFGFVDELTQVKKIRENILLIKKYFILCKEATDNRFLWLLNERQHFLECVDMYSLQDLIEINSGLCNGRGYLCELCDSKEVIFPFDTTVCICQKCSIVFHKICWTRKKQQCPKCLRLEKRASILLEEASVETENDSK
uniref:Phorbol-ester/DAG-type domain-containing protein n=1 Tax=Timema poppense TaxID=170557 RepID=A0A7R9D046_TIMPO|nr:unnamed protein product [Timema poppensis]